MDRTCYLVLSILCNCIWWRGGYLSFLHCFCNIIFLYTSTFSVFSSPVIHIQWALPRCSLSSQTVLGLQLPEIDVTLGLLYSSYLVWLECTMKALLMVTSALLHTTCWGSVFLLPCLICTAHYLTLISEVGS